MTEAGLLVDQTVVIAAERSGQTAYQMVESLGSGRTVVGVSVITVLELAHGVARANTEQRQKVRQRFLDDLLAGMTVWPVTIPVALRAGQIDGLLQAQGIRVAISDLLIGATALELGYAVGTHNVRHFRMIPDLRVKPL